MKKLFLGTAAALLLTAGCSKDEAPAPAKSGRTTYTEMGASLGETRTTLDGAKILWSTNDVVSVWSDETTNPVNYSIFEGVGASTARFRAAETTGLSGNTFYAVYPNTMVTGVGQITLPVSQTYHAVENFDTNTFPMAAAGRDMMKMSFVNLCGVLVVELDTEAGSLVNVNSIELKTYGDSQALAGAASIDFSGRAPSLSCTGSNNLLLDCGGVALSSSEKKAFYLVVPAVTYENGVDIVITARTRENGPIVFTKSRKSSFTVNPGMITRIGAKFTLSAKTYAVGDLYDAGGRKGIVFEVSDEGRAGKIIALNDCSADGAEVTDEYGTYYTYDWGPASPTAATGSTADGAVNMAGVIAAGIDSYPAFKACASLGDGWYIPARDEMTTLIDVYSSLEPVLLQYGGSAMIGLGYWCSNTSGTARGKSIYYFDAEAGSTSTVKASQQASVGNSVRAIAAF